MTIKNKIGIACIFFGGILPLLLAKKEKLELTPEEKVIKQAKFMGEIKSELAEGRKKLKPVYTKKIDEKKEIQSKPSTFKYTQTIAHLLVTLPKDLFPEAKNFKSLIDYYDFLEKNDKKKKQAFVDNVLKRAFEIMIKNLIDGAKREIYKTLFDHLKIREANFVLTQKEPVSDSLKGRQGQWVKNIQLLENKITEYEKYKINTFLINELKSAIVREEELKDWYVFYCGYPSSLDLLFDFITITENYLFLEKKQKEKSIFSGWPIFDSIDDFLNKNKGLLTGDINDVGGLSKYIYSVNIALYGNMGRLNECSCYYFLANKTALPIDLINWIKILCDNIGLQLDIDEKKDQNTQKLKDLTTKYSILSGKLKQFFVKPKDINTLGYLSLRNGYPYKKETNLREILDNYEDDHWFNFAEKISKKTIDDNLKLLREKPNNDDLNTTTKEKLTIDDIEINRPGIDFLQARLLANPILFDAYDVKTFYIFADENTKKKQEELKKELESIVKDMIIDALKARTIKGYSVRGKEPLVRLYKEITESKQEEKKIEDIIKTKEQTEQETKMQKILEETKTKEEDAHAKEETPEALKARKEWAENVDKAISEKRKKQEQERTKADPLATALALLKAKLLSLARSLSQK